MKSGVLVFEKVGNGEWAFKITRKPASKIEWIEVAAHLMFAQPIYAEDAGVKRITEPSEIVWLISNHDKLLAQNLTKKFANVTWKTTTLT